MTNDTPLGLPWPYNTEPAAQDLHALQSKNPFAARHRVDATRRPSGKSPGEKQQGNGQR